MKNFSKGGKIKKGVRSIFICLGLVAVLVLAGLLPLKVGAMSSGDISAFPSYPDPDNLATKSWFIYNLDPGEVKEDSMTVRNDSEEVQNLKIYAVDAITNNMGGFALAKESDEAKAIGKWIELEEGVGEVTLNPGEYREIKFKVSIPDDASVGEHAGGIIVQKGLTEEQKNTKGGFVITTRLGVRIYQTVPGEIVKKIDFKNIELEYNKESKKYVLTVTAKNIGNVTVEPRVRAEIKDLIFSKQNSELESAMRIPRDSELKTRFEFDRPRGGRFEVKVALAYEDINGEKLVINYPERIIFWAVPWNEFLILVFVLLVNLVFFFVNWIIKRKEKKYYKEYTVHAGEDLVEIAEVLGVKWQKLAKLNKLKAPYKLEVGQSILVIDRDDLIEYEEEQEEEIKKPKKKTAVKKKNSAKKKSSVKKKTK